MTTVKAKLRRHQFTVFVVVGIGMLGLFEVFLIHQGASSLAMVMTIVVITPLYVATLLTGRYLNERERKRRVHGP